MFWNFLHNLFHKSIIISIIIISFGSGIVVYIFNNQYIDLSSLEYYNPGKATILLDDQGVEWARFQLDKREPISFNQMPPHLINAFIAAEDWSFFSHQGISYKGIIRSIFVNLYHGRKAQGASTITQQLAKLLFLYQKKTFTRKIKEQIFALIIERKFTKEYILETYLNHVYFGCGIYGVQAASKRFWGINACEISIDQAATLAAVVRHPATYCPLLQPVSCKKRRNVILQLMHQCNFISKKKALLLSTLPISIIESDSKSNKIGTHLRETIRIFVENIVGKKKLYTDGFVIQTTLNSTHQRNAEKAFHNHCNQLKKELNPAIDGALISIKTKTGEIKALVGGYNFHHSQWNRALNARRQIGSTIKPLIYATALDQGFSMADTDYDEPFSLQQGTSIWQPKNYDKKFNGQITRAYALSRSNNIVAIKTLLATGADLIVNTIKRCHIERSLHTYPSLALGCIDATLIEVAGMFNVFAHHGMYVEPHFIKWIKNSNGSKIFIKKTIKNQAIAPATNDQVAYVLKHGIERLKRYSKPSDWINSEAIGKTGTTNDSRVCWFVGSTPSLTTAIYIGYDDNSPMGQGIFPIKTAFPIWLSYHKTIIDPITHFTFDPTLTQRYINQYTGKTAGKYDPNTISILENI